MNTFLRTLASAVGLVSLIACSTTVSPTATPTPFSSMDTETAWSTYYTHSEAIRQLDREFIAAELHSLGQHKTNRPGSTKNFGFNIQQPDTWFLSDEGQRILDIILSFQTPSGGWSKRTDMANQVRQPGVAFGVEATYIPTFDNAATTTQLHLLARAYSLTGRMAYRESFERGLALILAAQYPNGGWPQNYPLVGGYHDHITYNDEVMENILSLLFATSNGEDEFAFVADELRQQAANSLARGLECVLNTQVKINGKRTIWGAQHDARTLAPAKARAYEMVSLSSSESVSLLSFLMDLPDPSPELVDAIHDAMTWYEDTKILGQTWNMGDPNTTASPSAPPLWSRFYEIGTNRPVFGDRDHSIHYNISEISQERRNGYAWYTTQPNRVLKKYAGWAKGFPRR